MAKYLKLSEEIKEFIIQQKRDNPKLSCRGLEPLIKERFKLDISKSLINTVIKQNSLSSPIGRRRIHEPVLKQEPPKELPPKELPPEPPKQIPREPIQIKIVKQEAQFLENGGFFFLKAADFKLGLTSKLAGILSRYFPEPMVESLPVLIEVAAYSQFFKSKESLWPFIGREAPEEIVAQYSLQLTQIPFPELKEAVAKIGINHNFNKISELHHRYLSCLSSYIVQFFPPEYKFLDFEAMQERFYCMPAKLEKKGSLLAIQLFYPAGFFWLNDIIWQEGFSYAVNKINEAGITTPQKEQIWINPQPRPLNGSAFL